MVAPDRGEGTLTRSAAEVIGGFSSFRAAVTTSFVPLNVEATGQHGFSGSIRARRVAQFQIAEIVATPHIVTRTAELIARRDSDFYKVSLMLAGTSLLVQDGREAVLMPGDLALYDTRTPYSLLCDSDIRMLVLMFPQRRTGIPTTSLSHMTAVRVSTRSGIGSVVAPYLAELGNQLDLVDGLVGAQLADAAVDLLSAMYSVELGFDREASDPHRVLLSQIYSFIRTNLSAPNLDPAAIASAHYISTRHLHNLFQSQGHTVAEWIRTQRLERCRRDLLNPLHAATPVSAVAARWGLVDAAHFSRIFKAAYGLSPSEFRSSSNSSEAPLTDQTKRPTPPDSQPPIAGQRRM